VTGESVAFECTGPSELIDRNPSVGLAIGIGAMPEATDTADGAMVHPASMFARLSEPPEARHWFPMTDPESMDEGAHRERARPVSRANGGPAT